jgi:hypothetical protein
VVVSGAFVLAVAAGTMVAFGLTRFGLRAPVEAATSAAAAAAVAVLLVLAGWDLVAPRLSLRQLSLAAPLPWLGGARWFAIPAALLLGAWLGRTLWA